MENTQHKHFKGAFKTPSGGEIGVQLFVMLFIDDENYVAYCPSLDVSGYGATETEAKASFEVCLDEFFTYTLRKGTLFVELEHLGWNCNSKKRLQPPTLSELIAKNEELSDIWNNKDFTKFDKSITIPSPC